MAAVIKLKRGTSTPSTSDITSGEVAIDTSAKKLYINDSGTVKEIGGGSGGSGVSTDAQNNTWAGTDAGNSDNWGTAVENTTLYGHDAEFLLEIQQEKLAQQVVITIFSAIALVQISLQDQIIYALDYMLAILSLLEVQTFYWEEPLLVASRLDLITLL